MGRDRDVILVDFCPRKAARPLEVVRSQRTNLGAQSVECVTDLRSLMGSRRRDEKGRGLLLAMQR